MKEETTQLVFFVFIIFLTLLCFYKKPYRGVRYPTIDHNLEIINFRNADNYTRPPVPERQEVPPKYEEI